MIRVVAVATKKNKPTVPVAPSRVADFSGVRVVVAGISIELQSKFDSAVLSEVVDVLALKGTK